MMCNHHFVGSHDGVKCSLCGLKMNHDEYVAFCEGEKPPQEATPKKRGRPPKKVNEDA